MFTLESIAQRLLWAWLTLGALRELTKRKGALLIISHRVAMVRHMKQVLLRTIGTYERWRVAARQYTRQNNKLCNNWGLNRFSCLPDVSVNSAKHLLFQAMELQSVNGVSDVKIREKGEEEGN